MMENTTEDFCKDDYLDDEVPLPGFRFHPTDEELVGFYLRRQLDEKPLSIELIKQIDIYKYDPWDLPKASSTCGEKEGYFFCKRGRKYRNSIRPNRVTGSGFWKATGIDKPVYSLGGEGDDCIGLKKTLVYYRGSAGKGTKTDWMMHEFRHPSKNDITHTKLANSKNNTAFAQEAEIWTLCRIFKRNVSHRKFTPDLRQVAAKRQSTEKSTTSISTVEDSSITNQESYIGFGGNNFGNYHNEQKPLINYANERRNQFHFDQWMSSSVAQPQLVAPTPNLWITDSSANDLFTYENWDELGSIVKFAIPLNHSYLPTYD